MSEVYQYQFLHWFPAYNVLEDKPYSTDILAHLYYHLNEENPNGADTMHIHNTLVSSMLANGWIEYIMRKSKDDENQY